MSPTIEKIYLHLTLYITLPLITQLVTFDGVWVEKWDYRSCQGQSAALYQTHKLSGANDEVVQACDLFVAPC